MMFSKKTWLLTTVLLVTHGVPVYAMEPVVLSNDISVSRADPLDDGGRLPRDNLFWEVKQAELGGAGQCVASKNMTAGQSIRVTAGNFAISQVELINNRWRLPTSVATVPITLSFDRAIQPMVGTAIVAGPDRLQFALPDPAVAYDVFQQASALRASITLGNDVLARTFDLSGLKTALAETELCADIAPSKPIPERIKRAAPPPIPDRDPSPITENLRRAGPEISVAPGTIPPLEWPDVDPESVRMSDVPLKTPFPKSRVHPVVANPPTLNDAYSPSLARQNDVGTTGVVIPMKSNATAATSEPLPYEVRPQLRVEGPAVSTPSALPVTRRAAPDQIVQVVTVDTFRARKGEGLRDVLRRWADRAGVDLVWTMPGDILLDQDFSYVGVFSTAVKGLLADYPQSGITTTLNHEGVRSFDRQPFIEEARAPQAAPVITPGPALDDFTPSAPFDLSKSTSPLTYPRYQPTVPASVAPSLPAQHLTRLPSPVMNQPANTLQPLAWAGGQVTPAVVPSAPAAVGEARRWRALSGASMRQVLQAWAEEGNINLIWLAKQDFAVRSSVNQSVDFARAANDLLQQYAFEPMRPVGQIYIDPATRQKTLVVRAAVR